MIYWLFHDYRQVALVPALVLSVLALVAIIAALIRAGNSIRHRAEGLDKRLFLMRLGVTIVLAAAVISWYSLLLGNTAIQRAQRPQSANALTETLIAPTNVNQSRAIGFTVFMLFLIVGVNVGVQWQLRPGSRLRLWLDSFRGIRRTQDTYGSSHFANRQEYRRFTHEQESGVNLYGKFFGDKTKGSHKFTYLGDLFALESEDAARGIITIGNPGSGKSSSVILPIIYDCMRYGQNLVIADPQLELTKHVIRYAAIFGHRVIVHDPTDITSPCYNIVEGVKDITTAKAVAEVLVPKSGGGRDDFWTKSAESLLAACLIRFDNVGDIFTSFLDLKALGETLNSQADDAQRLAAGFIASATGDGKLASNIIATLQNSLTGWADEVIRSSTQRSDFTAEMLVDPSQPTIVILATPGRYRRVVAPYLGAVLTKILLDLDAMGEQTESGQLPIPVKFIIDEFPALGDLSAIVEFSNLVRKRRIAFLLALQTMGQLENIYGRTGAETLLAGMAFQVIFGGCDKSTAEYYSRLSGQSTQTETDQESGKTNTRSRSLLTADEIVRPPQGNAVIFGRYVTEEYATYVVVLSRLTRIYERADLKQRVELADPRQAKVIKRRIQAVSAAEPVRPLGATMTLSAPSSSMNGQRDNSRLSAAVTTPAPRLPNPNQEPRHITPLCGPDEWQAIS